MADVIDSSSQIVSAPSKRSEVAGRFIQRHSPVMRVTHGVTMVCVCVLLLSGFQIFNAHPALYWGEASDFERPVFSMTARRTIDRKLVGVTTIGSWEIDTTGLFGLSSDSQGGWQRRGFPRWLTIPGAQWLALGRQWHFVFSWLFALTGMIFVLHGIWSRHFAHDLWPSLRELRQLPQCVLDHLRLRHPQGEAAAHYNVLQKVTYLAVIFGLGPLMILTGLGMSPRMDTLFGGLVALAGGRQSVRTLHFILAIVFVLFTFGHVFEVIVTGFWNNLRSIITGRYLISSQHEESEHVSSAT